MRLPGFLGAWGAPPDGPAWGALAAAGLAALVAALPAGALERWRARARVSDRTLVVVTAFATALLSLGYAAFYLRGGPRIIDATTYFLEGRALSEGHFAWRVPEPSGSFRGRFLLSEEGGIAGIFPPGYPLLLSLGFALGAPMLVGPLLAAMLAVATWALARELAREAGADQREERTIGRVALLLSVACAALRYHTSDTMSHGACALAFALALLAALRARAERLPWFFLLAGLPLGFVVATRFGSAVALGSVVLWLAAGARRQRGRALAACVIGALPGLLLLLVAQASATGHALESTQRAYYAVSDGPAGCFRYGFGKGIGCLVEHGDFVRARGDGAYGPLAALGVTARRLRMHVEDVANFEPLALLIFAPLLRVRARASGLASAPALGVRAALALVGAVVVAYAPFYFDGDYPAGGARMFADVLPVEHALVALGLWSLLPSAPGKSGALGLALSCAAFAFHGAFSHEQLRDRDGGSPMFDLDVLTRANVGIARGHGPARDALAAPTLLFVDTDHGFNLGHDPEVAEAAADARRLGTKWGGLLVVRRRDDDHDRILYERLGHPSTWNYRFERNAARTVADAGGSAWLHTRQSGHLESWVPPSAVLSGGAETWRFESENEWPPRVQEGGAWVEPIWAAGTCASPASGGRALSLHAPAADNAAVPTIVLAVPVPRAGSWRITPRLFVGRGASASLEMELESASGELLASWTAPETAADVAAARGVEVVHVPTACVELPSRLFRVKSDAELRLVVHPPRGVGDPRERGPGEGAEAILALDKVTVASIR